MIFQAYYQTLFAKHFLPLLDIEKFSGFLLDPTFLVISVSVQTSAKSVRIYDFDTSFIEFDHLSKVLNSKYKRI